jgi:uncharacterized protein
VRGSVPDQRERLIHATLANPVNVAILELAPQLGLRDWWLAGGAVFQTVWNVVDGRAPATGIKDYDLFYFDGGDLSAEGELAVREDARELFSGIEADIEICNEARVHLWYESEFGVAAKPFKSTRDAIDHFASTTCCYAVSRSDDGELMVYAPHGYDDLFTQCLRPNPMLATQDVYERKAARWMEEWPGLKVQPWLAGS